MNLSSDVFLCILFRVDGPINEIFESNSELIVGQCHGNGKSVGLLVKEHVIRVSGLHQIV